MERGGGRGGEKERKRGIGREWEGKSRKSHTFLKVALWIRNSLESSTASICGATEHTSSSKYPMYAMMRSLPCEHESTTHIQGLPPKVW